jgi:hypothetical protein
VPSGSPGLVKTSGSAASTNGSANQELRVSRSGPRPAAVESPASTAQAIARAANDPAGSRLMATMKATARTTFSRASARCSLLSRAR